MVSGERYEGSHRRDVPGRTTDVSLPITSRDTTVRPSLRETRELMSLLKTNQVSGVIATPIALVEVSTK